MCELILETIIDVSVYDCSCKIFLQIMNHNQDTCAVFVLLREMRNRNNFSTFFSDLILLKDEVTPSNHLSSSLL